MTRLSPDLALEGVFRSAIQSHQNVNYVFFGSRTHMLKRMFGEHSRPFYNSAGVIELGKPPESESTAFVRDRFGSRQVGIDETVAERIVRTAENIPYYLQQLCYFVFEKVIAEDRDWVEPADVESSSMTPPVTGSGIRFSPGI